LFRKQNSKLFRKINNEQMKINSRECEIRRKSESCATFRTSRDTAAEKFELMNWSERTLDTEGACQLSITTDFERQDNRRRVGEEERRVNVEQKEGKKTKEERHDNEPFVSEQKTIANRSIT
jgi:hypothetical protein